MKDRIIDCIRFPSPNPHVLLYNVTYLSNGLKVKGLFAEPKKHGKYEGFLYLRGGIKNVGKVRPARIAQIASEGFIVFAPFYRGNQGGEGDEDFGGNDRYDAFSAFELLKSYPKIKNGRVHVFGFSRGGVMALFTALHYPDAASVVTWGGVSDMFLTYEERVDLRRMMKRVIGGTPSKVPENYRWRTPLYEIEKLNVPLLIIHGMKDVNVGFEHALRLEKLAKQYNKMVETLYFEQYNHYFPPKENMRIVNKLTTWMKEQK